MFAAITRAISLLLLLWVWLPVPSVSAADTIIAAGNGPVAIVAGIDMLRDRDGLLDITKVAQADAAFKRLPGTFSQGFSRDVFWLRFTLARAVAAGVHWWLVAEPTFIDDLRVYAPDGRGGFVEQRAGDHVPLDQRPVAARETIFPLDLSIAPQVFYLRVQSTSTLALSLALWQPEGWASGGAVRNGLHGIFFGMMLAAVFISSISALWLRQRFFVVATAYLLAYGVQHMVINGYDQLLLYPAMPTLSDRAIGFVATLVPALFLFFALLYLEPRAHCPRLTRGLSGVAWISLAACGLSLAGYYPYLAPHMPAYVAIVLALIITLLVAMRRHQPLRMRMMLLLFLPGGIAIVPQMLRNLGLLPANFWTTYLWSLSVFLQLLFAVFVILQRVREEEQKHQSAKERAIAQRNLLDMIAHELRTPLAVVEATLANIEVRTEASQPELKPRFERIALALARLNTLVDNALDEERLDAGTLQICPLPLAPSAFIRQVCELASMSDAHPLKIDLPADDRCVPIDAHWLGLALLNLLDNAVKYSPVGGAIELTVERITERKNDYLVMRVCDHGIGIPPAELDQLGERFFRAGNARILPGVKGLGLGLYLVRQVVEQHGGRLQIDSQPGQGSTFSLTIPVAAAGE